MVFSSNVEVVFEVSLFASLPADAVAVNTGGVPPSTPVRLRLHYLMSLRQPGVALPPPQPAPSIPAGTASSSLALQLGPVWSASEISIAGSRYFAVDELAPSLMNTPPPWLSGMNQALATLSMGGLLPPMNLVSVMALTTLPDNLARIAFDHIAFVRGDEVQFGIVLTSLDLLQNFAQQQLLPLGVRNASIAAFLREEPMLAHGEDCAVELGRDAFGCFCYPVLAAAEAAFLTSLPATSAQISSSAGTTIRVRQDYASPAPLVTAPDGSISMEMQFELDGACALPGVDFMSSSSIELDVKITARGRLVNVGFLAMYVELELEADFNAWDLSGCAGEILGQTGLAGLALAPGYLRVMDVQDQELEGRIAAQIVGFFQGLQPDPVPAGQFVPFAANSRAFRLGADNVLLSLPIPVLLDAIGSFSFDPNSIRSAINGRTFRIGGSLLEFDSAGAGRASAPIVDIVRDEFALSFEPDCAARRYSSLAFSVRSSAPNFSIMQIVVPDPVWNSLFTDGLLRWVPSPGAIPISVPDGRAITIRCEFTAVAAVGIVLGRMSAVQNRDLVVIVGSNQLPVVVRWRDPLRRLRELTPADIDQAREICRRGPISTPFEILRRPPEFDLIPDAQPFWGEAVERSTQTLREALNIQYQPWEIPVSQPDLRIDAHPGVFALLMQSAARRK